MPAKNTPFWSELVPVLPPTVWPEILAELPVPEESIGQSLRELQLPSGALVLLIRREDRFVVPRGNTRLETGDILTLMGTPEAIRESEKQLFAAKK